MVAFIVRELQTDEPIVNLRILAIATSRPVPCSSPALGVVLYGTTALLPLFLQTLLGYPALEAGLGHQPAGPGRAALRRRGGPRSSGSWTRACWSRSASASSRCPGSGSRASPSTWRLGSNIAFVPFLNGLANPLIFIALSTMSFGTLRREQMGGATGIYNLMRNLGGSVGIATATALLVRRGQIHQNYLAGNLSANDPATAHAVAGLQSHLHAAGADAVTAHHMAMGAIYRNLQQASLMAYVDGFRLLGYLALICVPFILLFQGVRQREVRGMVIEE